MPIQRAPVSTGAREIPEDMLQPLAREMNFSETVFVLPPEQGGHARIRIFTPATELRFAGHPTLGSAFVLAAPLQLGEIRLETKAGVIPVRLEREGARITFGWMEQLVPEVKAFPDEAALLAALRVDGSELPVEVYDNGMRFVYVALGSQDEVARVQPDFATLGDLLDGMGASIFGGSGTTWKTRMFAPDASSSATRSRSRRERRSGVRPRSSPERPAQPDRSRASRSEAPP